MTNNKRYQKPKMKCPWCDRVITINGMTLHIATKHPEHAEEFKSNRDQLINKFRVDENGALIDDGTTNHTITQADHEVISEQPPDPPEPIVREVPTPPTPTPTPPTPPPEPKVRPTNQFQEKEDDPEEDPKPKEGYFYDPYGFGK